MSDITTLTLPEIFDINQVDVIKDRMDKALSKDINKVDVKVDKVQRVDSAGIQLLLSFKNAVIDAGKEFIISNPSDEFLTAIELLGSTELLELKQNNI